MSGPEREGGKRGGEGVEREWRGSGEGVEREWRGWRGEEREEEREGGGE